MIRLTPSLILRFYFFFFFFGMPFLPLVAHLARTVNSHDVHSCSLVQHRRLKFTLIVDWITPFYRTMMHRGAVRQKYTRLLRILRIKTQLHIARRPNGWGLLQMGVFRSGFGQGLHFSACDDGSPTTHTATAFDPTPHDQRAWSEPVRG